MKTTQIVVEHRALGIGGTPTERWTKTMLDAGPNVELAFSDGVLALEGPQVKLRFNDVRHFSVRHMEVAGE